MAWNTAAMVRADKLPDLETVLGGYEGRSQPTQPQLRELVGVWLSMVPPSPQE